MKLISIYVVNQKLHSKEHGTHDMHYHLHDDTLKFRYITGFREILFAAFF